MNINNDESSKDEISDRSGSDLNEDDTSGGAIDLEDVQIIHQYLFS